MEQAPAKFTLQGVQVKESFFTQSEAYSDEFKVSIEPSGIIRSTEHTFQLHLKVRIYDEGGSFEARVHQVGNFVFNREIQEAELSQYFLVNAPAILFPFVRSYVSALTALSGYSTITIPAMNLLSMREQLKENTVTE
ncbi:MAG: hypothetical protein EOO37_00695 [Cytophagaceae bacterium]|nr:MAG: hypothetical protein EOO37_00695 [Cytophagaceae bacterium]